MTEEKKLYKIIKRGSKEEIDEIFNYIYDKYKPLLIFIASKYLSNKFDVMDVVQDTFVEFFNNAYKEHKNIKYLLTITCKHNALDFIRKNKRINLMDSETLESSVEDEIKPNYTYVEITSDLRNTLSAIEYEIMMKHIIEGYQFNEIAKMKNINISSVKSIYYRSIEKYKKKKGLK